jgi:anti-repressor protein
MDDDEKTTAHTPNTADVTDIATIDTINNDGVTDIVPFDFEELAVRVTDRNGTPWFVLTDVCRVLGLKNPSMTARSLDCDEVTTVDTLSLNGITDPRAQQIRIVSESGLYSLIMTSRKPQAQRFKKWLTAEVLPTIRRMGSYNAAPAMDPMQALNDPAVMRDFLLSLKAKEQAPTNP